MIDAALQNSKDYDAFIAAMIVVGCEVKRGKILRSRYPERNGSRDADPLVTTTPKKQFWNGSAISE